MAKQDSTLRNSGVHPVGSVPWGTHFCQFYQTREDLLDTLVPYFKNGLENNEFCMWVTAEPLGIDDARNALGNALPGLESYEACGQIEILSHKDWYLLGGGFDQERVLQGWVDKLNSAITKGFDGLRLTGNTFWLERKDWQDFANYEAAVNDVIGQYKMLALCTYSLDKCTAGDVIDVIRNHDFALIKQQGGWEIVESAQLQHAREALSEAEKKEADLLAHMASFPELNPNPVIEMDILGNITYLNPAAARFFPGLKDNPRNHPVVSGWEKIFGKLPALDSPVKRDVKVGRNI